MTNSTNRVEIITSVQRRRRWTAPEKVRMVEETLKPGMTVSLVARRHGIAANQLFTWRRLVAQGSLTAAGSGEEVVPAFEWLSDNGSCYVAGDTRSFARDIGLEPRTTPLESPQSNGMAEAFVRTIKRDYVRVSPRPDAETVMRQLPTWIAHYNEVHPHKALGYRSPREFIAAHARP